MYLIARIIKINQSGGARMNERVLYLIEVVEEGFNRYDCPYDFENGIEWNDNGKAIGYEAEALKQDIKDIMDQIGLDCKNNLIRKEYQAARDCIPVLERLNNLLNELEQE